jgi:hypothetical protein
MHFLFCYVGVAYDIVDPHSSPPAPSTRKQVKRMKVSAADTGLVSAASPHLDSPLSSIEEPEPAMLTICDYLLSIEDEALMDVASVAETNQDALAAALVVRNHNVPTALMVAAPTSKEHETTVLATCWWRKG